MAHCPKCLREFEVSGGYCPHDGNALKAGTPHKPRIEGLDDQHSEVAALERLKSHGAIDEEPDNYDHLLGTDLDGRYHIIRKLGEGGMGVVFQARHVVIDKPCAIKVLKRQVASDQSIVKRFVQEAQAASSIGHPNIVDVTDFGETDADLTYQVMEYVEGATLSQFIEDSCPCSIEDAVPIVSQIANALSAAHKKGIVHRDLKPENIFLTTRYGRDDFVKIVDFGIAKVQSSDREGEATPRLTRAGTIFGTPEYMAPEQASGNDDIDARADIYSLGIIFFELITGVVPLQGETTLRTVAMQILDEPERPREAYAALSISDELEDFIMSMLEKKREDRVQSMDDFLATIEELCGADLARPVKPTVTTLPEAHAPSNTLIEGARAVAAITPDPLATTMREGNPPTLGGPQRKRSPTEDPAFMSSGHGAVRANLDHLEEAPAAKKAVPWAAIAAAVILVAGATVFATALLGKDSGSPVPDASLAIADASSALADATATANADAGAADAGATDAAAAVASAADAGRKTIRNTPKAQDGAATVILRTQPRGGQLWVGKVLAGPDGVDITQNLGTKTTFRCTTKAKGYRDSKVTVVFDGKTSKATCKMSKRAPKSKCVDGVLNPFNDECTKKK